jgi:hypothetical protein
MTGSGKIVPSCLSVILGGGSDKRPLLPGRIGEGTGDSAVEKCREPPYEATNATQGPSQRKDR